MDHDTLLQAVKSHFDEKTDILRKDLKDLDTKLDSTIERLTKVETEHGFIKKGLAWFITTITTASLWVAAKVFNIKLGV